MMDAALGASGTDTNRFGSCAQTRLAEFLPGAVQHSKWKPTGHANDRRNVPPADHTVKPSCLGVQRQLPCAEHGEDELAIEQRCPVVVVRIVAVCECLVGVLIDAGIIKTPTRHSQTATIRTTTTGHRCSIASSSSPCSAHGSCRCTPKQDGLTV